MTKTKKSKTSESGRKAEGGGKDNGEQQDTIDLIGEKGKEVLLREG